MTPDETGAIQSNCGGEGLSIRIAGCLSAPLREIAAINCLPRVRPVGDFAEHYEIAFLGFFGQLGQILRGASGLLRRVMEIDPSHFANGRLRLLGRSLAVQCRRRLRMWARLKQKLAPRFATMRFPCTIALTIPAVSAR